jgi:hypothetical protein
MAQPNPAPPITEQMREHARQNPNSWLYIADPGYAAEEGDVPPEGIVGAYRIDPEGEIDEDFQFNDQYVPSEMTANPLEPSNELERVLVEIAAGQRAEDDLPPAVLDAELLLYAPEQDDRMVYSAEMSDGSRLVPACTSEQRVPEDWPGFRRVPGNWLPDVLDGLDLGLNLHEAIQAVIPNAVLARTARERG